MLPAAGVVEQRLEQPLALHQRGDTKVVARRERITSPRVRFTYPRGGRGFQCGIFKLRDRAQDLTMRSSKTNLFGLSAAMTRCGSRSARDARFLHH